MTMIKSRRRFLGATAAAAALSGAPLGFANGSKKKRKQDLALVNGRIHILDKNDTVVDSVLIRDGRFVKVGRVRDTHDAEVINLRGRTVIPGIVDNHCHFIRIGNAVGHDERRLETAFTIPAATFRACGRHCGHWKDSHIASRWYIGRKTPPWVRHSSGTRSAWSSTRRIGKCPRLGGSG